MLSCGYQYVSTSTAIAFIAFSIMFISMRVRAVCSPCLLLGAIVLK